MSPKDFSDFTVNAPYLTIKELADKYQVSEETAKELKDKSVGELNFPESTCEIYDQYARIRSSRTLIIGDIECPEYNAQTLEMALAISKKFSLDTMIINGDLIALDSFSTWVRSIVYKLTFKDELKSSLKVLETFSKYFRRIFINCGNHERRLAKALGGELSIGDFFNNLPGVEYSEYSYSYLESGNRKPILVAHQDNYSRNPLTVARTLASIEQCCVICGHTHFLSQGFDISGKNWIVDGGSARDPQRTFYKVSRKNLYPSWNLGFCFVIDGVPFLVNKDSFPFYMNGVIS